MIVNWGGGGGGGGGGMGWVDQHFSAPSRRNQAGTVFYTASHRPVAGRLNPTEEKGWGCSGSVTRASLHSSPGTD